MRNSSSSEGNTFSTIGQNQSGQIVVEYILLIGIGVVIAMLVTSLLVSRNEDDPGFLIQAWNRMLIEIGADLADDAN